MEQTLAEQLTGLSEQQQLYFTWAFLAFGMLGKFISAMRRGGGLKHWLMSIWLGENIPKAVAEDYKTDQKTS